MKWDQECPSGHQQPSARYEFEEPTSNFDNEVTSAEDLHATLKSVRAKTSSSRVFVSPECWLRVVVDDEGKEIEVDAWGQIALR